MHTHTYTQVELCSLKLVRAQELISGLGGEKDRWMEAAENLRAQFGGIMGDMLVRWLIYTHSFTRTLHTYKCTQTGLVHMHTFIHTHATHTNVHIQTDKQT